MVAIRAFFQKYRSILLLVSALALGGVLGMWAQTTHSLDPLWFTAWMIVFVVGVLALAMLLHVVIVGVRHWQQQCQLRKEAKAHLRAFLAREARTRQDAEHLVLETADWLTSDDNRRTLFYGEESVYHEQTAAERGFHPEYPDT